MIYIILLFSFLLECSFSNILSINSILIPLFLLTSLTIIYPYLKKEKHNFIIICTILGLLYDISFYNSAFINTISFGVCSIIIIIGYNYLTYNILNANIINLLVIIFYRIISYLLLCLIDYLSFNGLILLKGIYSSLIINILYGIIIYIIIDLVSKIFKIKIT